MKPYKICETWIDLDAIFAINDTCDGNGIVHLTSRAEPFVIRVWGSHEALSSELWQAEVDDQWASFITAWKVKDTMFASHSPTPTPVTIPAIYTQPPREGVYAFKGTCHSSYSEIDPIDFSDWSCADVFMNPSTNSLSARVHRSSGGFVVNRVDQFHGQWRFS